MRKRTRLSNEELGIIFKRIALATSAEEILSKEELAPYDKIVLEITQCAENINDVFLTHETLLKRKSGGLREEWVIEILNDFLKEYAIEEDIDKAVREVIWQRNKIRFL